MFQEEIRALALQIAKRQRNEGQLQPLSIIIAKFNHELEELKEAANKWDEIPDIVYYATCAAIQGDDCLLERMERCLEPYGVTMEHAQAATLAKYRRRASGLPKDIEAERKAILEAIEPLGW